MNARAILLPLAGEGAERSEADEGSKRASFRKIEPLAPLTRLASQATLSRERERVRAEPALARGGISIGGIDFHADAMGALIDDADRALIVADLHLEKGSAFARRGQMLPPFDTAATLARLTALVMRHRPRVVIALGDSFHDRFGWSRMAPSDRDALAALQAGRDWIWIFGNHDPVLPEAAGGERHDEISLGALSLRHEPSASVDAGEIAGHFHPVARIAGQRRRCFVTDGHRLVMPAFGAYAGGLNLHDAAIARLFGGRRFAHVLGREQVYAVCASRCMPD